MPWKAEFTDESLARLRTLVEDLARLGEFNSGESEKVADAIRRGIKRNFEQERSPDGSIWPPLAESTEWQRRQGIDERGVPFSVGAEHPILRRTDSLMGSYTDPQSPLHVTDTTTGTGSTSLVIYGEESPDTPGRIELLHEGGRISREFRPGQVTDVIIPPRPWVGLDSEAQDLMFDTIFSILGERLKRAGT